MAHIKSRKTISFLLALVMVASLFSGLTITVSAENLTGTPTGYTKASDVVYDTSGTYLKNWGARGETCTFLTSYAQSYYTGSYSYENLAANAGGTTQSNATDSALYAALQTMLQAKHTTHTSYQSTRYMYCYTDCVNNNIDYISSFYSSTQITGTWDGGSTWNREHTWPHSKDADTNTNTDSNDSNDIMMLRPTAVNENSSRSNKAYGESTGYYDPNTVSTAVNVHGDCARILLFVYTEYGNSSNDIWNNMWGTSGVIESKEILLKWMAEDPVDTWEMGRNDVTEDITGVRNVFVDYPELAFQLFGEAVPAGYSTPSGGSSASAYTVTATSNNNAWGTVSVNGNIITATPAAGYYAAGYLVTSGTATVNQVGNTFTVSPSSDCTVQINFAAKTPVTVTYVANGSVYLTATGYAGEAMTLPTTATAVDGWTFSGWSASTIAETTDAPEYLNPGASFTLTANTTLYALYTKTEAGSGSGDYVLVETPEDLTSGTYLIVYTTGGLAFDGSRETLDASGNYISVSINNKTIASSTTTDASAFTIDPNVGTILSGSGYYIGAESNSNTISSSKTTAYTNTISLPLGETDVDIVGQGGAYLRYNTGGRFRYYKSSTYTEQQAIQLYKKDGSAGITTYTTSPVTVIHDHEYGAWTTNNNGTHSRTCSVCGATETEDCTYTDVVTAPTVTEEGYTTHTCTVCGYSFVDTYVPALGIDYTVTFTTPDGITAPADMISNTNTGITLPTAEAPDGYTFLGWVTVDYDNVSTRPAEILTGNYIAPSDITLKALYSYSAAGGSSEYTLVTDPADLVSGSEVIITANGEKNSSLSTTQNNNNRGSVEGVKSADYLTFTPADTTAILTLGEGTTSGTWSFYDEANSGYLYAASSSSNYLRTQPELNANGSWTIAITDKEATVTAQGSNSRNILRYNSQSNLFACYASGQQTVFLYQKVSGSTLYTTVIHAAHTHTPGEPVIENNVDPTCTEAGGYDSVVYCTECHEEISRTHVTVAALGHDYQAVVTAPTCTEQGYTTYTCSRCNDIYVDDYTDALGHDFGDWTQTTAPTCTAKGEERRDCSRCDAFETREVDMIPHTPGEAVEENRVEPTCTADGSYESVVYCTVCGAEISRETVVLEALGHDYKAVVTAPTCTEAGYTTYTCSRCGDTYTADEVAALGHLAGEPVEENRVEPTTTAEGGYDTVVYCTRCGAELSREHTVLPMITVEYFVKNSISLAGDIGVNFYVNLNEVSKDNAKVVFTWGSGTYAKTQENTFSGLTADGDGNYKLSVQVYAKQMTEMIHAELYDGTEKIAEKDYCVADYCRKVLNMPIEELTAVYNGNAAKAEKLVNLCKAMLIYGGTAQMQFGYRTDDLAYEGITYTLEDVGALGTTTFPEGFAEACGIEFWKSSLMLESETSYRMYFSVTDQAKLDNLTVKLGDETLTYTKSGSYIYYSISNIPAKMILSDYTLTFGDQTVTANAGEYIAKALDIGGDDLKETAKALYWYSTAAIAYFAK